VSRIGRYRWWIGGLLFASTVINYLDRQTLSVLGPTLKTEFHWSNQDFALIIIAFRVAYAVMQTVAGRVLDRVGTRNGLTLSVLWYSSVAVLTSFAAGLRSFCGFRFLLGAGEAANWPGATKAVSEWFPRRERGWAVALFDSGSSVGAAVAPALVVFVVAHFGGWRPAFVVTGLLGFAWLVVWRLSYHPPETHPRLGEAERAMILADRAAEHALSPEDTAEPPRWSELLRLRQTWGVIAARGLTDPVWFMIADWFAIYLAAKGFSLEETAAGFWVPFLAADLGNFFGGGFSSHLIRRGWSVGRARKALVVGGAAGVLALVPAAFLSSFPALIACFAVATFSYAAMSTMALSLPADLYQSRAVASVSGMSGTAAGLGTIGATYLIGIVADRFSFTPILLVASVIPLLGAAVVLLLVRNTAASGQGLVKVI
jgi:ACS family hexuronate transporter-like MFS transporter